MNLFRRLTADVPGELLAAQINATSHIAKTDPRAEDHILITGPTRQGKAGVPEYEPAPEYPEIWAALAAVADNPGVIDHTSPGLPLLAGTRPNEEIS